MARRGYNEESSELSTPAVLKREIPWDTYLTARLISDRDLQLIKRYDKAPKENQASLLKEVRFSLYGDHCFRVGTCPCGRARSAKMLSHNPSHICVHFKIFLRRRPGGHTYSITFILKNFCFESCMGSLPVSE